MVVKIELLLIHLNQFNFDPVSVEYKTVCPHTQWDIALKDIIFRKEEFSNHSVAHVTHSMSHANNFLCHLHKSS